jgi:ubiquinone/menaquinone biosynthesis C-methylase UbiE
VFALAAASVCGRVIAVDVSPAMVEAMKLKVAEQEATNVECVWAGFLSYQHHGALADFVYTRNALHHLPDFWKGIALTRMAAVLVPGGTLRLRDLLFSFDLPEADARIAQWLDTAAAESSDAGWTRDELETHLRNEYSNVQLATRTVDPSGGLRNRGRRLRNSWSPRRLHLREISSGAATLGRRSPPSDRVSSAGGVVPFLRVLSL